MLCDVCHKREAAGVYSSRIAPVSCAYCSDCMKKGAEPYGVLVTRLAFIRDLRRINPVLKFVVEATLRVENKSVLRLLRDVMRKKKHMKKD